MNKYTYEPVDDSLSRIIAYGPDTIFPSMSMLSPESKKKRRQMLRYEDRENYMAVYKAEHLKEHSGAESDSDSNEGCDSENKY